MLFFYFKLFSSFYCFSYFSKFISNNFFYVLAISCSYSIFFFFLYIWYFFDLYIFDFQFLSCVNIYSNTPLCFGIDHLSLFFLLLTAFITPFCLLSARDSLLINNFYFLNLFLFLEFIVILSFITLNFFLFYFFFETLLIPMFFMIGLWGSSQRRILAANYFFFFTLTGSFLLLIAIIFLFFNYSLNYYILYNIKLPFLIQHCLWWLLFFPFAVKIPMFPFHIWLPEAHVEAPTAGSMFLAAILLKLGAYGFLRYLIPLIPEVFVYYQPFMSTLALISVYYTSFIALRQLDIKRIIAYSSIAHMNFALLGLFTLHLDGLLGSMIIFLGHGLVSAGLFYLVGIIYDRYKTRLIVYYTGLVQYMPLYVTFLFFFSLGNIAFPGTINFLGEFLILTSLTFYNFYFFIFSGFSLFFSLIFTFWVYTRISFGTVRTNNSYLLLADITKLEFFILMSLLFVIILLGLYPNLFLLYFEFFFEFFNYSVLVTTDLFDYLLLFLPTNWFLKEIFFNYLVFFEGSDIISLINSLFFIVSLEPTFVVEQLILGLL